MDLAVHPEDKIVVLSEIDRNLLTRCLSSKPNAWKDFVDRFLGLVIHVVNHTVQARSIRITTQDREDLAAEVFLTFLRDDFGVLRRFRGGSSLSTYLTVIARRVVVRALLRPNAATTSTLGDPHRLADHRESQEQRIDDRDEVERLIGELNGKEADVIRMYHLEEKSYDEISRALGMPANSIGPTLSRARARLRERAEQAD